MSANNQLPVEVPPVLLHLPRLVGEVGGQPAVRPDREQHELGSGVFELCRDEPLGSLFG